RTQWFLGFSFAEAVCDYLTFNKYSIKSQFDIRITACISITTSSPKVRRRKPVSTSLTSSKSDLAVRKLISGQRAVPNTVFYR
ncbi:MAG: hypothetical protein ACJARN_001008, partial [Arenicella sp.]